MAETAQLDDIDMQLIALLRENGRAANRDLASSLGVSEATVRNRIRRLTDGNIARVTAVVDFSATGNDFFVILMVQVEGRPVKDVASAVADIPNMVATSIVSGRCDIVSTLLARDKAEVLHVIADRIGTIPGVKSVESAVALDIVLSRAEWAGAL